MPLAARPAVRIAIAAALALCVLWPATRVVADQDRLRMGGSGQWIAEIRIPDAYMPKGLLRDVSNDQRIYLLKDAADPTRGHLVSVTLDAYIANYPIKPNPHGPDCPVLPGGTRYHPGLSLSTGPAWDNSKGGYSGNESWDVVFQPVDDQRHVLGNVVVHVHFNGDFASDTGSIVDAAKWLGWHLNDALARLVSDKGWSRIEGQPPAVMGESFGRSSAPPAGAPPTPPPPPPVETPPQPPENAPVEQPPAGQATNRDLSLDHGSIVKPGDLALPGGTRAETTPGDDGTQDQVPPVAPGPAAAGAVAVGLLGALSGWLMLGATGQGTRDAVDGLEPAAAAPPRQYRDGEVNERGEVWSDEDGGWVGRSLYDQERARRARIDQVNDEAMRAHDAGIDKAVDQWRASQQALERLKALPQRRQDILARMAQLEDERKHHSESSEIWKSYRQGVSDDLDVLAREGSFAAAGLRDGFEMGLTDVNLAINTGLINATDAISRPENWKTVARGGLKTAFKYVNPVRAVEDGWEAAKFVGDAVLVANDIGNNAIRAGARVAGHVAESAFRDPVAFAATITGYENWSKALDYHVPVTERLGCAVMAAVDTTMTFGGTIIKGAEAAEKAVQKWQQAREIDRLARMAELTHAEQVRKGAWISGTAEAEANVKNWLKNPGDQELLKAIQSDHRSIQAINRNPSAVELFNRQKSARDAVASAAAQARVEKVLAEEGLDLSTHKVKARFETNPSARPKAGADLDVTYSIYDKDGRWVRDVPADKMGPIYNDEYYKAWHNGQAAKDAKAAEEFAERMRVEHVDTHHLEAYGNNPRELEKVLREPGSKLSDADQVGKAIGYKTGKELKDAEELRLSAEAKKAAGDFKGAAADMKKAEEVAAYGYRQSPKQAQNILEARAAAARQAGHVVAETPEHIQFGLELMKRVEGTAPGARLSPVEAEKIFRARYPGRTLEGVAHEVGDRVAAFDILAGTPKAAPLLSAEDAARLAQAAEVVSRHGTEQP